MKTIVLILMLIISGKCTAEQDAKNIALPGLQSIRLVGCSSGKFQMGENTNDFDQFRRGVAEIALSKFYISETELSQKLWESATGLNFKNHLEAKSVTHDPSSIGDDFPVFGVSYFESIHFCEILTELARQVGKIEKDEEFRLPTEAEWEYACRAGSRSLFSSGDSPPVSANLDADGTSGPVVVYLSGRNSWGIAGMHGNVAEWVLDSFGIIDPEKPDPVNLTYLDIRRPMHILRGGSFSSSKNSGASSSCTVRVPWLRSRGVGFRFVLGRKIAIDNNSPFTSQNLMGDGT